MSLRKPWTKKELLILLENRKNLSYLIEALPDRSTNAIKQKAFRLKDSNSFAFKRALKVISESIVDSSS